MDAHLIPGRSDEAKVLDQRQGVFGGTFHGTVIGVNYGTINVYTMETGPSGTVLHDGAAASVTVLEALKMVPRLPRVFYDREDSLAIIQTELRPSGGAWVSGQRGAGLSLLLRHIAYLPDEGTLSNGAVYLDGAEEPDDLDEILRRLYVAYHSSSAPLAVSPQAARAFLSQRRALFVFDQLPLDRAALIALADTLSQSAVFISGEAEAPDTMAEVTLGGLPAADAMRLLSNTAKLDGSAREYAHALQRICATLGHLPLPLFLAGKLLLARVVPPEQLASVLEDWRTSGPAHHRTPLALAARLALQGLTHEEVAVLTALARTRSMARDALAEVTRQASPALDSALARLMALGLATAGNERYQVMSVSLRRTLDEQLPVGEERRRHAAFFAAAAPSTLALDRGWLLREQDNLLQAINTLLDQGHAAQAGQLAQVLQPAVVLDGRWSTWGRLADRAAEAARATGDRALEAWALHEQGTRAGALGDAAGAARSLSAARELRLELGDTAGAEASLHNMRYLGLAPTTGQSGDDMPAQTAPDTAPAGVRPGAAQLAAALIGLVAVGVLVIWMLGLLAPQQPVPATVPSDSPASVVSVGATSAATPAPTPEPTTAPAPSAAPRPSPEPTTMPTPTAVPTLAPSPTPTLAPTAEPTAEPTSAPTAGTLIEPTSAPIAGTSIDPRNVRILAVNPDDPRLLYAVGSVDYNGGISGLYRTRDGGTSWQLILDGRKENFQYVAEVALAPRQPSRIYATVDYEGQLLRSADAGDTWDKIRGLRNHGVTGAGGLLIDPNNPQQLYVNGGGVLYRSSDGGATWAEISLVPGGYAPYLQALAVVPQESSTIYAGTTQGLYRTTDNGSSWTLLELAGSIGAVAVNPRDRSMIFAGTRDQQGGQVPQLFRSTDGGDTWQEIDFGARSLSNTSAFTSFIVIPPSNPDVIYMGNQTEGLLRSTDGGDTWQPMNQGFAPSQGDGSIYVDSLAIDPSDPQLMYITANYRLYRSVDGGGTWQPML
jgi:photosystem II stability/assembly factor-like uncharacterized protein